MVPGIRFLKNAGIAKCSSLNQISGDKKNNAVLIF